MFALNTVNLLCTAASPAQLTTYPTNEDEELAEHPPSSSVVMSLSAGAAAAKNSQEICTVPSVEVCRSASLSVFLIKRSAAIATTTTAKEANSKKDGKVSSENVAMIIAAKQRRVLICSAVRSACV